MHRQLGPALLVTLVLSACSEPASGPSEGRLRVPAAAHGPGTVLVCHKGRPKELPPAALGGHLSHGDYVAELLVDPATTLAGDGVHFRRLTDAILGARAARVSNDEETSGACRITILAAAGTYVGSFEATTDPTLEAFPLIIDVPDITLQGALDMEVDSLGRATGASVGGGPVSALRPNRALATPPALTEAPIVVVGHPGGFAGNGVEIRGFAFSWGGASGTTGGVGIVGLRADNLTIEGNRFEAGYVTATDLRASNATVRHNAGLGLGANCSFCLTGPGSYTVDGNSLLNGGLGGAFVLAVIAHAPIAAGAAPAAAIEPYVLPASAHVDATIRNNEFRGHVRKPVGFGVRVGAVGSGAAGVPQSSTVLVEGNTLTRNTFNIITDAAFPAVGATGNISLTLAGNAISVACQTDLFVTFSRQNTVLPPPVTPPPMVSNSSYQLTLGGDVAWANAWYYHPAGLGNTLTVDGTPIANAVNVPFDATRSCP